jgi:hypothetical protein
MVAAVAAAVAVAAEVVMAVAVDEATAAVVVADDATKPALQASHAIAVLFESHQKAIPQGMAFCVCAAE